MHPVHDKVLGFIRDPARATFEALALEVFAHQFELVPAYRRVCEGRGGYKVFVREDDLREVLTVGKTLKLAGNEPAIGMDLLHDPIRRRGALAALSPLSRSEKVRTIILRSILYYPLSTKWRGLVSKTSNRKQAQTLNNSSTSTTTSGKAAGEA